MHYNKIQKYLQRILLSNLRNMSLKCYEGDISIKFNELNLDLTLLGGQSFRWVKKASSISPTKTNADEWCGVAHNAYWILTQRSDAVAYKVYPAPTKTKIENETSRCDIKYYENLLRKYLRADFDLNANVTQWKQAHEHFSQIAAHMKAVRVLDQEPLENILSFICSQNNHIKRISSMINWLCASYGERIGQFDGDDIYAFPTLQALNNQQEQLESALRAAKFGYRAKFLSQTVAKIASTGGDSWFDKLRKLPYAEARLELTTLPGIGFKVADCICLMSLGHLAAVPIDTHIFKIAQTAYMPALAKVKSVTPKIYDEIAQHFRDVYGEYAGWAQAVLFCSELQQFQSKTKPESQACTTPVESKRKKKQK